MVDGADRGQRLSLSEMHECGVGKIHGPISISFHQLFQVRHVHVRYWEQHDSAGAYESPRSLNIVRMVAKEIAK